MVWHGLPGLLQLQDRFLNRTLRLYASAVNLDMACHIQSSRAAFDKGMGHLVGTKSGGSDSRVGDG